MVDKFLQEGKYIYKVWREGNEVKGEVYYIDSIISDNTLVVIDRNNRKQSIVFDDEFILDKHEAIRKYWQLKSVVSSNQSIPTLQTDGQTRCFKCGCLIIRAKENKCLKCGWNKCPRCGACNCRYR